MRSIEDINADSRANEVPPIDLIDDFLDHVHPGNFQETYGLLTTKLQRQVLDHAIDNRNNFDVVIDEIRSKGGDPIHWIAFRDWALKQREVIEAPPAPPRLTLGEIDRIREVLSEQGWQISDLRVAIMRAKTAEDKERLERECRELQARFDEENAERFGAGRR